MVDPYFLHFGLGTILHPGSGARCRCPLPPSSIAVTPLSSRSLIFFANNNNVVLSRIIQSHFDTHFLVQRVVRLVVEILVSVSGPGSLVPRLELGVLVWERDYGPGRLGFL